MALCYLKQPARLRESSRVDHLPDTGDLWWYFSLTCSLGEQRRGLRSGPRYPSSIIPHLPVCKCTNRNNTNRICQYETQRHRARRICVMKGDKTASSFCVFHCCTPHPPAQQPAKTIRALPGLCGLRLPTSSADVDVSGCAENPLLICRPCK